MHSYKIGVCKKGEISLYISSGSIAKRILGIFLSAVVLCSALTGCGGSSQEAESKKEESISSASSESSVTSGFDVESEVSEEVPPIEIESSAEVSDEEAPKVAEIESIEANLTDELKVNLSWSISSGASGYEIYRMSDKTGSSYEQITNIEESSKTSYTDEKAEPGIKYYYQIRPYISKNDNKYYGEFTSTQIVVTLPAVSGLTIPTKNLNSVSISWDKIPNVTAYVVYRQDEDSNGEYFSVATITETQKTGYTDFGLEAGKAYKYKVEAYVTIDGQYYYSDAAEIDTWTGSEKPAFTVKYDSSKKKINVQWSVARGADGYTVYLSTSQDDGFKEIGTSEKNELEYKIDKENIYYVRVSSYCTINGDKKYSDYDTIKIECGDIPKVHGYSVGTTYIEISLDKQHMWFYKNGELIVSTDVVTGYKNAHDTPTGLYYIINKASPAELVGETWDVWVNYWLGVTNDGIGIHDSTWRYSGYGGNIYTYDGSHGCINTPYDAVKKIYDNCEENTPVVIY